MIDLHALTLEHEGQRLSFKCDYRALLKLEELGDWRDRLAEAISLKGPTPLIEVAAIMTGKTTSQLIELSPPLGEVQRCISGAWALAMEGPEGLRKYADSASKEDAEDEAGKPRTTPLRWVASFWRRFSAQSGAV
jgi:hypothetical protein